jgi:hypothetical protein
MDDIIQYKTSVYRRSLDGRETGKIMLRNYRVNIGTTDDRESTKSDMRRIRTSSIVTWNHLYIGSRD